MPRVAASLAVEILVDAHLVRRESGRHGTLRLLTTATRLATDRSIAPADVAFAHRLIEHFGSHIASGVSTSRQELAALGDATIAIDRALARLASSQLLHWSPPPQRLLSCAEWDQEAVRLALHQREQRRGRDLWRFGVVARFLTVDRCRRLILLRYFGDDTPRDSCGQCDMCRGGA